MKKEDFIVGNWYKSKYDNYFKFLKFEDNYFYSSEEIINNKWPLSATSRLRSGSTAWAGGLGLW